MFFNVKKWADRFSEYPNRRKITKTDGTIEQVTVTRDEGTVFREGDKFNASTMNEFESRISSFDSKISNQLGTVDDASSASEAYTVGSYIIHNGVRYKVTAAIAKGDAFNEGTNISKETVNNQIAELNTKITSLNADLAKQWEKIYPVGSIYISANPTSPAELFGGIWEQIKDRFLLAAGDTYTAGDSGGSASHSHTLSDNGAACIGNFTDVTAFSTGYKYFWKDYSTGTNMWAWTHNNDGQFTSSTNHYNDGTFVRLTGSTDMTNSMPPYLAVYMWKRTA